MNKFAPKLTHHLQCFIYAAHWHKGYSYTTLARTFDVHKQTVSYICRDASGAYNHVKKEADRLGLQQMWDRYSNHDLEERVLDAIANQDARADKMTVQRGGEGIFFVKDWQGNTVGIDICHLRNIPESERTEYMTEPGYYLKGSNDKEWYILLSRPFRSIDEALRYLARFPPS